jgi:2-oxoisovalerate dehydrogenase E1 component
MTTVTAPAPALDRTSVDWPRVARTVLASRLLDNLEEQELAPSGKIAYQFSAKGHELAEVLLCLALTHPHDAAAVYYRSRPFMLAAGLTLTEALASGFALSGSLSAGRDTGLSHFLPPRGGPTVLPMSGNVGAQYSPAAGWAQAIGYHTHTLGEADWAGALAAVLGGDGSTAANGFWAALNIATTLALPLLFLIEDNGYAISVPGNLQNAQSNIAASLSAFPNLHILEGDGTDPADASQRIAEAVAYVRAGRGPCLLRLSVVRLSGHSFTDNQAYKTAELRAAENARDPLARLKAYLPELDWPALEAEVERELRAALDAAIRQPPPDDTTAATHVFFEGAAPQVGGLLGVVQPTGAAEPETAGPRINLIDAVRRTLDAELAANPRLLVYGEDVGVKGGVHGATVDLQLKYGAARVFDTSLNEDGIIGRAAGLAYAGLMPVPEIQFRKYLDPATEQINDAGWVRWRTANQFAAPMVVRIPVGFGKKTGDPWHSVTGEAVLAHTLGWRLAFPSNAADAAGLLRAALRGHDPTFFFEHRALLDTVPGRRPYPGDDYVLPFGQAAVVQVGTAVTVVTWGAMVYRCEEAARAWPGQIEILDLRTIVPWDRAAVLASVRKTGKLLVVHEDTLTAGFAGEIIATVAAEAFDRLDAPIGRLGSADCPVPYSPALTGAVVPGVAAIAERLAAILAF